MRRSRTKPAAPQVATILGPPQVIQFPTLTKEGGLRFGKDVCNRMGGKTGKVYISNTDGEILLSSRPSKNATCVDMRGGRIELCDWVTDSLDIVQGDKVAAIDRSHCVSLKKAIQRLLRTLR